MQVTHRSGLEIDRDEKLDLKRLWSKYVVFWPFYLLVLILSLIGAWFYLRYYTVPLYESNARILIKDKNKGVEDAKALEDLNLISIKKTIENEVEVIQSRTIISDVVKNLLLYAPMYEKGKIHAINAYNTSPVKIEVMNVNTIKPVKEVPFTFDNKLNQLSIGSNKFPLNKWVSTQWGMLRFIPNNRYDGKLPQQSLFFTG